MYVDALEHHCRPDPKTDLKMLGEEFAEFIDTDLEEEIAAGPPAQQQWLAGARQALPQLLQVQQLPLLTRHPLGSWNMQHIWCRKQFSTMKKVRHVHPRCALVRDQPAKGKDREEWTPKRQTGSTWIRGSLFLLHHWYEMLLPRKISADKDVKSTNGAEQSKKGSWSTTIKLPTDVIDLLPRTPATRTTTRP
jgi:hypothetical protein